jgi:hypothetical protein
MKSKGLGDSVEKLTTATGVKAVVDALSKTTGKPCGCAKRKDVVDALSKTTGKPCGCAKRKDTLNRMFPYKQD